MICPSDFVRVCVEGELGSRAVQARTSAQIYTPKADTECETRLGVCFEGLEPSLHDD
jgi:hypothetical protein